MLYSKASMKRYVIKDVEKTKRMLHAVPTYREYGFPRSFKMIAVNLLQFDALVQLTAHVYCR
jgi:hypothetical protein